MRLRKANGASFLLLVVVVAFSRASWSQEVSIFSPSEAADVYGDWPLSAGASTRIHFLYPAADFMSLPESYRTIVELAYRPGRGNTLTDPVSGPLTLRLSTTAADSLSMALADNTGDDGTPGFEGTLTWQDMGPGPSDFDFVVPLDKFFKYDPSLGENLLDCNGWLGSRCWRRSRPGDEGAPGHSQSHGGRCGEDGPESRRGESPIGRALLPEPAQDSVPLNVPIRLRVRDLQPPVVDGLSKSRN